MPKKKRILANVREWG